MPHPQVCPWYMGYFLASPVRRLFHNPHGILRPYLRPGMTALEIGPGMGFFTLPIAEMVGPEGKVVALDVQEKMLDRLTRRAVKAGLDDRIVCRRVPAESLQIDDLAQTIDFALAFAVAHEVPDRKTMFEEILLALRSGGMMLMADPVSRFSQKEFDRALNVAATVGFRVGEKPAILRSRAAVLTKP